MIPLRPTEPVKRFPRASLVFVLLWLGADLLSRFWHGPRADFLLRHSFVPADLRPGLFSSGLFHGSVFATLVTCLFIWVFTPRLLERRGAPYLVVVGLSGWAFSLFTYRLIFPASEAPLSTAEGWVGAMLGATLRHDIWSTVTTLVPGPGWLRIYEVPSYVLLFFWLFYLLIGFLFLNPPFSNAPMPYWIPFSALLWGFAFESLFAFRDSRRSRA